MKKILVKLSLMILLVALLAALITAAPFLPRDPVRVYQQKHELISGVRGRKIICVGGSGVWYSVSAAQFNSRIKAYQTVNMGYNAGLGLAFNLEEVKPYIRAGDVVLLAPEYSNYQGGHRGSTGTLLALNAHPGVLRSLPPDQVKRLVLSHGLGFIPVKILSYLDTIGSSIGNTYAGMNLHGDVVVRSPAKRVEAVQLAIDTGSEEYSEAVSLINNFHDFCAGKGARAYLVYPAFPANNLKSQLASVRQLHEALSRHLRLKILNTPEQASYPPELFHDTAYHLNQTGRAIHTQAILERLSSQLAAGAPAAFSPAAGIGAAGLRSPR